jgi:hypothetical protein
MSSAPFGASASVRSVVFRLDKHPKSDGEEPEFLRTLLFFDACKEGFHSLNDGF